MKHRKNKLKRKQKHAPQPITPIVRHKTQAILTMTTLSPTFNASIFGFHVRTNRGEKQKSLNQKKTIHVKWKLDYHREREINLLYLLDSTFCWQFSVGKLQNHADKIH